VFIPFIDDPTIQMVESPNLGDIESLPRNKWGIPEPIAMDGRMIGNVLSMEADEHSTRTG
jgi:hypothetical protein